MAVLLGDFFVRTFGLGLSTSLATTLATTSEVDDLVLWSLIQIRSLAGAAEGYD
jgi:hypothetical protein